MVYFYTKLLETNSTMKKILFLALFAGVWLQGCKELDKLTQFEMDYSSSLTTPSSTGIDLPINFYSPDIESDSESAFAINDTRKELVEEIRLTRLDLTVTSPSNGDFSFLESIEIYLSADSLPEIKIAWKDRVPGDAGKLLELETSGDDLKEYIKKDDFSLRLHTVTDEILTSDHEIEIYSLFFVDAEILGQ